MDAPTTIYSTEILRRRLAELLTLIVEVRGVEAAELTMLDSSLDTSVSRGGSLSGEVVALRLRDASGQTLGELKVGSSAGEPAPRADVVEKFAGLISKTLQFYEIGRAHMERLTLYKLVNDNMPVLIAYWDADQRCRYANRPYFDWFGFEPESLYGVTMLELLGPDLHERNRGFIEAALRGEPQFFDRDLVRKIDGQLRHTQAQYLPDRRDGKVHGFFVLVSDVTEKKRARLEALQAKEAAVEASRVKSRFLANMSHEIRTPMNGALGMLNHALDTDLTADQRRFLMSAKGATEHLLLVISEILDISKIEAGEMNLVVESFTLREAIEAAVSGFRQQAEDKGLLFVLDIEAGLPERVQSDPTRLKQVVMNLVGNAVKFTRRGYVQVRVFREPNGDVLSIEVSDTGIGIRKELLTRLFVPFRQGDDSGTRSYGGTGLGLAICKELVALMGGSIFVESALDEGSTFKFSVPLKACHDPLPQERPIRVSGTKDLPPLRGSVLVVEDDDISAEVLTLILRKRGCDVARAHNGQDAVDFVARRNFDLVLMDMLMPGMDGPDAAAKIRELESDAGQSPTPIVALTANAFEAARLACLAAGMTDFVAKPVSSEALFSVIDRYLAANAESEIPSRPPTPSPS